MPMLDSTAFELADFEWPSRYRHRSGSPKARSEMSHDPSVPDASQDIGVAALTLAGCAACQQALGACAVHYANAGALSPGLALSICNAMQRLINRAFEVQPATISGHAAFVLLGPARDPVNRRADFETLAETMR
jgi:hypothetical protein